MEASEPDRRPPWFDRLMYLQRPLSVALAPHVEKLWYCEGYEATHRRERVLPNERFQLIIDLTPQVGSSMIVGMRTRL